MAIRKRISKSVSRLSRSNKSSVQEDFGTPGAPIDDSRPFYFGFLATSGALIAFVLLRALAQTSQIMVLILTLTQSLRWLSVELHYSVAAVESSVHLSELLSLVFSVMA